MCEGTYIYPLYHGPWVTEPNPNERNTLDGPHRTLNQEPRASGLLCWCSSFNRGRVLFRVTEGEKSADSE